MKSLEETGIRTRAVQPQFGYSAQEGTKPTVYVETASAIFYSGGRIHTE